MWIQLLNLRRDNFEAAVQGPSSNRRFYDSHEKGPRKTWHPELPLENQKSDIRRSSDVDSAAQLSPNNRRSGDNHQAAIVEQPLHNRRSYDNNDKMTAELNSPLQNNRKATAQKTVWRPAAAANQQRWYDKYSETVHRSTNRETPHPYNQRSHDDVEATSIQLSKNRPQHNEGKAQRVMWRPYSNSRRVYDKNGNAIAQQPLYNNGADKQPVKDRAQLNDDGNEKSASNSRRWYDKNDEPLQQPSSNWRSFVNNHEATASKPRRLENRNDKIKSQRVLWQPSSNQQQRWFDKNGQAIAQRPSENDYRATGQQPLSNRQ